MTDNLKYLLLLLLALVGCGKEKTAFTEPDVVIFQPEYSSGFSINGYDDNENSVISVTDPWQGAEGIVTRTYLAKDSVTPEGFEGQVIIGIPEKIVCMSSTHIAMLDALGETGKIVGVSGLEYVSNPEIRKNKDKITDVGYEGNMNYEALVALEPDLILLFSINGASSLEPKLKEFGIPYIYIGDYVEETPLGKTEWIIPIAEILGKRDMGESLVRDIKSQYNDLCKLSHAKEISRPKVMLNTPFTDSWFMPSTESYVARMMDDAGADYIYKKNTGSTSMPIDIEEAYKLVSEADFWLNTGAYTSLQELKSVLPKFKDVRCVKNGKVFNNNLRRSPGGGNDCYESGVVNPHLILRDLIKIFHPELIEEEFVYYQQLK